MHDTHRSKQPPEPIRLCLTSDVLRFSTLLLTCALATVLLWCHGTGQSADLVALNTITPQTAPFQLDVNKASWPELSQLPGIGEKLGNRIISYREAHGPFEQVEELVNVRGIGPRVLEKIRPYVVIHRLPLDKPRGTRN